MREAEAGPCRIKLVYRIPTIPILIIEISFLDHLQDPTIQIVIISRGFVFYSFSFSLHLRASRTRSPDQQENWRGEGSNTDKTPGSKSRSKGDEPHLKRWLRSNTG